MGTTKAERAARDKAEREAAWEAEQARVTALGDLFTALPEGHSKAALLGAMTDRIIDLYNHLKFEQGDAILEFLPNGYARALLDWYFDDSGPDTFECPPEFAEQPDVIFEVFEVAQDLVALWDSPRIQGLARVDRNGAIDATRTRLKEAVYVAQDLQRSSRNERPCSAGVAGQSVGTQDEAPSDYGTEEATIEGETPADQASSGNAGSSTSEAPR